MPRLRNTGRRLIKSKNNKMKIKRNLRNGNVVTKLGTFKEAVKIKKQETIRILISLICILLLLITAGICELIF